MKLLKSLEIAKDCGLSTIGEAVLNIDMHSLNIFSYDVMSAELNELYAEYDKLLHEGKINKDTVIDDAILVLKN